MVKKIVFISILIILLSINIVAAEDTNVTTDTLQDDSVELEQNSADVSQDNGAYITIENVVLNTSDVTIFNKGDSYNATLTYDDGTSAWNQSIVFDVNGVKYTKVTNNSGFAGLNINLNQGTYVI